MKLEITQEDIDEGISNDNFHCPVALALRRWRPEIYWSVDRSGITDTYGEPYFKTSTDIRLFIDRFDKGKPVEPMMVDLIRDD